MCFQTDILPYLRNHELCVQHFKNLGLLARSLKCPICKNCLIWTKYKKSKTILTGSVKMEIVRNEWRAYREIVRMGLEHRTVNHSINFVEPDSGVHTQHIELYWYRKKTIIKRMLGCHRSMLHGIYKNLCGEIGLIKTLLLIFVSISTCFIHSIINFLVKKLFSCWGGGAVIGACNWGCTRCTWGGEN